MGHKMQHINMVFAKIKLLKLIRNVKQRGFLKSGRKSTKSIYSAYEISGAARRRITEKIIGK